MISKSIIPLLMSFVICLSFGQEAENYEPFRRPTAPSVFEFLKYGNVPINEYTGKATITIPIHNVAMKDVQLPLKLNYTTGGIRVNQEAGTVGLGWDFTLPAVVQTIMDRDDYDLATIHKKLPDNVGNPAYPVLFPLWPSIVTGNPTIDFGDPFTGSTNYTNIPLFYEASRDFIVANGRYTLPNEYYGMVFGFHDDSEPDIFRVTLNGEEIIMTTDRNGYPQNGVLPYPLIIINEKPLYKVTPIIKNGSPNNFQYVAGFKITDPEAVSYFFDVVDEIKTTSTFSGHLASTNYNSNSSQKTTSKVFKLSKIRSRFGEEILISYNSSNVFGLNSKTSKYYRRTSTTSLSRGSILAPDGQRFDGIVDPYSGRDLQKFFNSNNFDSSESQITHSQLQNYNYVDEIITPTETLKFNYSTRSDYRGMKKLDKIVINNLNNRLINEIDFSYSYSTASYVSGATDYTRKRLILNTVQHRGQAAYEFEYNSNKLPVKDSYAVDYWGYHNNKPNTSLIPPFSDLGYPAYTDNHQNDFNSDVDFAKSQTLERITYPTGGHTRFEYELHSFDNYIANSSNGGPLIDEGHGLRISRISDYSNDSLLSSFKEYSYSGGKAISPKKFIRRFTEKVLRVVNDAGGGLNSEIYITPLLEISIDGFQNVSNLAEGDYIGYDEVSVTISGGESGTVTKQFHNNKNRTTTASAGKYFNPLFFSGRTDVKNGTVASEFWLDINNIMSKRIDYTYDVETSSSDHYGVRFDATNTYVRALTFNGGDLTYLPNHIVTTYPIYSNSQYLQAVEEILYENGISSVINKTEYLYDSKHRVSEKKIFNPSNPDDYIKKVYKYHSYTPENFIGSPRSIVTWRSKPNIPRYVVRDQNIKYVRKPNLNNKIYFIGVDDCARNSYYGAHDPSCDKTRYTEFDLKGNPLVELKNDELSTILIWGYFSMYPIARIENASYDDLSVAQENAISEAETASNNDNSFVNENTLRDKLQNVRDAFPHSMVTTYTYDPSIGLTSITDPRGYTSYYTYDNFNRLHQTKDHQQQILSENEYKYRNN